MKMIGLSIGWNMTLDFYGELKKLEPV